MIFFTTIGIVVFSVISVICLLILYCFVFDWTVMCYKRKKITKLIRKNKNLHVQLQNLGIKYKELMNKSEHPKKIYRDSYLEFCKERGYSPEEGFGKDYVDWLDIKVDNWKPLPQQMLWGRKRGSTPK